MPYRILCNDAQREGAKLSPELVSSLFCYVPLHKIRYGILREVNNANTQVENMDQGISICHVVEYN